MTFVKDTISLPEKGILHTVNKRFHDALHERKSAFKDAFTRGEYQVVIRVDDRIMFVTGEQQRNFTVVSEDYHHIKAIAHLPLLMMYTSQQRERRELAESFAKMNAHPLFKSCTDAIERWLNNTEEGGLLNISSLKEELQPIFAKAMDTVAQHEVEKTVEVLNTLREESSLPLDKTYFVVFGSHQARYKQLGKMIIQRWFNQQLSCYGSVDHHVKYCEGGNSIDDAYELLSTALASSELAHTFLGDQYALNQDVVTQTAERHISQFWPK
ncbi:hypothetical protein [Alteromonas abrolhosensis]|jgi:hypothetical protein|uniref:hypothetical protein n=1 Tax=Alteromonas abrolhosensis TaxID=1892904 RepID=UPI003513BC87